MTRINVINQMVEPDQGYYCRLTAFSQFQFSSFPPFVLKTVFVNNKKNCTLKWSLGWKLCEHQARAGKNKMHSCCVKNFGGQIFSRAKVAFRFLHFPSLNRLSHPASSSQFMVDGASMPQVVAHKPVQSEGTEEAAPKHPEQMLLAHAQFGCGCRAFSIANNCFREEWDYPM